jgi:hypothetical protein
MGTVHAQLMWRRTWSSSTVLNTGEVYKKLWNYFSVLLGLYRTILTTILHHYQLLPIRPCGLFQLRNTSEIMNLFRHMVGLLGRVISPSQGLCLHRTTQHRKTRTNIYDLRNIRTHNPSIQVAKAHAPDRAATEIGTTLHNSMNTF